MPRPGDGVYWGGKEPQQCSGTPPEQAKRPLTHRWNPIDGKCKRRGCGCFRRGPMADGKLKHFMRNGSAVLGDRVPPCEGQS
jgi:hypothetical protein